MNRTILTLLLFTSIFLGACASKGMDRATCEQADWYEIGRRDGAQGFPNERLSHHQRECAKAAVGEWEMMYANGRNAGLVEYCADKNGYDLGRAGVAYYYVCPSTVEKTFLGAYHRGQAARTLEIANQKLDEQITDLAQRLSHTGNVYEQRKISNQLSRLRIARAKNDKALGQVTVK